TSSPGPTPAAASAMCSADVPLLVARQNRAPTNSANAASSAFISGPPAPDSTPRSSTRCNAAWSAAVRNGQRRGFTGTATAAAESCRGERRDVLDGHIAVRRVPEHGGQHAGLAPHLGRLVCRIAQHLAVATAEDVEAVPGEDLEVAEPEQRREHRLDQGLAGLAVAAVERHVILAPQLLQRRRGDAERRGEVHVRVAAL